MTKRQVSIRVDDAVLAAVDAAGGPRQRSATIEAWLAAQAAAQAANAVPVEQQGWYRAGVLAEKARDELADAEREYRLRNTADAVFLTITAVSALADAIDALAGTAPEEG